MVACVMWFVVLFGGRLAAEPTPTRGLRDLTPAPYAVLAAESDRESRSSDYKPIKNPNPFCL